MLCCEVVFISNALLVSLPLCYKHALMKVAMQTVMVLKVTQNVSFLIRHGHMLKMMCRVVFNTSVLRVWSKENVERDRRIS